jgi:Meckel syndrome type 1 protein
MSLNIQQQIRDNSRDLSAYLQDLNAFTSDVKAKDEALTREEVPVTAAPAAPVRGRVAAHRVKSESEVKAANRRADETTGARVSATTPSTTAAATPSTTTTDVDAAASEKALGNACFKRGEYEAAIAHYTASLEREGATCAAHANRAMCAIKLERWSDAAADCDAAIAIDPGYLKAHQRRGVARRALGRFLESTMDFENALRLEPESKILRAEREASKAAHELEANVRITQVRRIVPVRRSERAKAEKAEKAEIAEKAEKAEKEETAVEATPSPSKVVALESSEGEGERRGGGRDPKTPPEVEREPPSRAEPVLLSTEEDPPPPPRRASPPSPSPSASARNKPKPPSSPPPSSAHGRRVRDAVARV